MTRKEYMDKWTVLQDRIEWQTTKMFDTIKRLDTTTYAHFNDQLNDALMVGRCAETIKKTQAAMMRLTSTYCEGPEMSHRHNVTQDSSLGSTESQQIADRLDVVDLLDSRSDVVDLQDDTDVLSVMDMRRILFIHSSRLARHWIEDYIQDFLAYSPQDLYTTDNQDELIADFAAYVEELHN